MKTFVLVLFFFSPMASGGVAIDHIEGYATRADCIAAKETLPSKTDRADTGFSYSERFIIAYCIPHTKK